MKFPMWAVLVLYAGAAYAGDGGPVRDLGWGAVVADNGIAYVPFDIGGSMDDRAAVSALQPNGELVLGGYATTSSSPPDLAIVRTVSSQGAPDAGFGTNGKLRLGASTDAINDVAILADGRIVYAARTSQTTLVIGRLLSDGTSDATFNGTGRRLLAASAFISVGSLLSTPKLLVQADGKIVVVTTAQHTIPDVQQVAAATRLKDVIRAWRSHVCFASGFPFVPCWISTCSSCRQHLVSVPGAGSRFGQKSTVDGSQP